MNKIKVMLDTGTDCANFVQIANTINEPVFLEDGSSYRVNAKSLMGVMYGKHEFTELYVISDNENIATKFLRFIV